MTSWEDGSTSTASAGVHRAGASAEGDAGPDERERPVHAGRRRAGCRKHHRSAGEPREGASPAPSAADARREGVPNPGGHCTGRTRTLRPQRDAPSASSGTCRTARPWTLAPPSRAESAARARRRSPVRPRPAGCPPPGAEAATGPRQPRPPEAPQACRAGAHGAMQLHLRDLADRGERGDQIANHLQERLGPGTLERNGGKRTARCRGPERQPSPNPPCGAWRIRGQEHSEPAHASRRGPAPASGGLPAEQHPRTAQLPEPAACSDRARASEPAVARDGPGGPRAGQAGVHRWRGTSAATRPCVPREPRCRARGHSATPSSLLMEVPGPVRGAWGPVLAIPSAGGRASCAPSRPGIPLYSRVLALRQDHRQRA